MHVLLPLLLDLICQHFSITLHHYNHTGIFYFNNNCVGLQPYYCLLILILSAATVALSLSHSR